MYSRFMMRKHYYLALFSLIYSIAIQGAAAVQDDNSTSEALNATEIEPLVETVFVEDDKRHVWTSQEFPKPYPFLNQSLIIKTADGYFISITVNALELNGRNGDFLVIKEGDSLESEGKGKIFTYFLKSPKKYLVYSNTVYLKLQVYSVNYNKTGFQIYYKRVGEELVTSSEIPTTAVDWPTPSGFDSIYYTVYVSGKNHEEYKDASLLRNFTSALTVMATEYCAANNISLKKEITDKNVQIYYLMQCPRSWPGADICAKVRFALPVLVDESSPVGGYQLTEARLEQMWIGYASKHLPKYGMDVYREPDNDSALKMWIIIICITLIVFVIMLYFVRILSRYISSASKSFRKRKQSDTTNIVLEGRTSNLSLAPHPYQSTPSLFDNDYSFDQYEPDIGIPPNDYTLSFGKRNEFSYPLSEDEGDDDIVYSTFSSSHAEGKNKETDI